MHQNQKSAPTLFLNLRAFLMTRSLEFFLAIYGYLLVISSLRRDFHIDRTCKDHTVFD